MSKELDSLQTHITDYAKVQSKVLGKPQDNFMYSLNKKRRLLPLENKLRIDGGR